MYVTLVTQYGICSDLCSAEESDINETALVQSTLAIDLLSFQPVLFEPKRGTSFVPLFVALADTMNSIYIQKLIRFANLPSILGSFCFLEGNCHHRFCFFRTVVSTARQPVPPTEPCFLSRGNWAAARLVELVERGVGLCKVSFSSWHDVWWWTMPKKTGCWRLAFPWMGLQKGTM